MVEIEAPLAQTKVDQHRFQRILESPFSRLNENEVRVNLTISRIHSTANGTTIFTRIIAILSLLIPVVLAIKLIRASNLKDCENPDIFSFPGPAYFVTAFVFSTIPLYWILFNVELRNSVSRNISRHKNKVQPILPIIQVGNPITNGTS